MCGIAGFCDFSKKSNRQTLVSMTDVLHHRGPDDSGYSFYENDYASVGLGHRRLSILDLTACGHQPMRHQNIEIIFNGEVYNFKEIKRELEARGYIFESNSDTEVILKAYHQWGIKAVDKFIGMFAICIYDKKAQKLVLIRDRAGVKPCYCYYKDGLFMFASELKSFHKNSGFKKQIDKDALALYMQYGYIPEPYTIFEDAFKLKAGHYLELEMQNMKLNIIKYWDVVDFYNMPKLDISENEAIDETKKLLESACEYRMVSDVPVGMFLSGGYDSSTVAALLQSKRKEKLNTFTIGFQEKSYNEAPFAKDIAKYLGTNHTEYYCTQKDALDILPKLPEIYDEPFGDSSAIPTTLVSQLARKNVTVSLSADGGDEIFGGYTKYTTALRYFHRFNSIPHSIKALISLAMDNINPKYIPILNKTYNFETRYEKIRAILKAKNSAEVMKYISEYFTKRERDKILKVVFNDLPTNFDIKVSSSNDEINQMLAVDYKTYMVDDILHKVDRATMSVGLEGREPLLDHRIIEYVAQLPSHIKIKNGDKKWLLKQIAHQYLPKEVMDRPKQGFGVPIQEWFKEDLREYFEKYLNKKALKEHDLFVADEVIRMKDEYLSGANVTVTKLWFVLMFQMWYSRWM